MYGLRLVDQVVRIRSQSYFTHMTAQLPMWHAIDCWGLARHAMSSGSGQVCYAEWPDREGLTQAGIPGAKESRACPGQMAKGRTDIDSLELKLLLDLGRHSGRYSGPALLATSSNRMHGRGFGTGWDQEGGKIHSIHAILPPWDQSMLRYKLFSPTWIVF